MLTKLDHETELCAPGDVPATEIHSEPPAPHKDTRQRRAGANILRFFALVLVLTLIARGTAAAALASVQVAAPGRTEIVEQVRVNGNVKARDSNNVKAPEGLTLKQMLVTGGQKIKEGDPVAQFDMDEITEQLARETAALNALKLKLQQLQRGDTHDGAGLSGAQRGLEWAQQDLNTARANGDKSILDAKNAVDAANAALEAATAQYNALPEGVTPEEQAAKAAALEAMNSASGALTAAQGGYESAKSGAEAAVQAAERALESAKQSLASAQSTDADAQKQAADSAAQNKIDAQTAQLDIDAQNKKVSSLKSLHEQNGFLLAPAAGNVLENAAAGDKTTTSAVVRLSSSEGGFEAEAVVGKDDAKKLVVGAACDVSTSGGGPYYNPSVQGSIIAISVPDETGNVTVTIKLPDGDWAEGQSAEIKITQSRQTYPVCVPLNALYTDNSGFYVLEIQQKSSVLGIENVLVRVPVTLVAKDGVNAAVEGALSPDAKLAVQGSRPVKAGDRVRVEDS